MPDARNGSDPSSGGSPPRVSSPWLVGRDAELAKLLDLLADARSGRPRLVLVGGDAGVGKSRLLAEFTTHAAEEGARTLVGRCVDLGEGGIPFAPFAQVFATAVDLLGRVRAPEVLGPARHELARIVPQLAAAGGDVPPRTADDQRARLFGAVVDAFRGLVRSWAPLVIALEDLHWARGSTLDLLNYVVRNLVDEQLLMLATFRSDELHRRHPLRPVLGELSRLPEVHRFELEALTDVQLAELIAAILGGQPDAALVADIAARSAGNPFYAEELVAASREGRPGHLGPVLHDVVVTRIDRLPEATRDVVEIAAVAGPSVHHQLLTELTDHTTGEMARVLRPAVEHHILRVEDDTYRFRHELVREVVTDELLPSRRTELHRRTAQVLEAQPQLAAGGREHVDGALAHHWHAAGDADRAFHASLRAAERSREAAAFAEALDHYERALGSWDLVGVESPGRGAVLEEAATAAGAAGRYQRSIAHLRAALDATTDPGHEADLRRRLAFALWWSVGDHYGALEETRHAHGLVGGGPPSPLKAEVIGTRARLLLVDRDRDAIPLAGEAVEIARTIGDRTAESHALNTLGTALAQSGAVEEGVDLLREALALARDLGDAGATGRAFNNLFVTLRDTIPRDREAVDEVGDRALDWLLAGDHAHEEGPHIVVAAALADDAGMEGCWERAERLVEWMARHHLEGHDAAYFANSRARLRWMQGRLDEAAADTRRLHRLAGHGRWFAGWAYALDALIAAARGQLDDVRSAVDEGRRVIASRGHADDPTVMALRLLRVLVHAEVDAARATGEPRTSKHAGRAGEAVAAMRALLAEERPITPGELDRASMYQRLAEAELTRATGPDPDAWRSVLEHTPFPYWQVHTRWRLAEALLDRGSRDESQAALRAAQQAAIELGAAGLRAGIEALARRARLPLPGVEVADAGDLGLTPREAEVLELVAAGRTNREIGAALYITAKTASVHVSNILAKLRVDDRYQAADRARELGLDDDAPRT